MKKELFRQFSLPLTTNRLVYGDPETGGEAVSQAEMTKQAKDLMEQFDNTDLTDDDLKTLQPNTDKSKMVLQKLCNANGLDMPVATAVNTPGFTSKRYFVRKMLEKKFGASETVTAALDTAEGKETPSATRVASAESEGEGWINRGLRALGFKKTKAEAEAEVAKAALAAEVEAAMESPTKAINYVVERWEKEVGEDWGKGEAIFKDLKLAGKYTEQVVTGSNHPLQNLLNLALIKQGDELPKVAQRAQAAVSDYKTRMEAVAKK